MVEGTGLENQRWKHPQVRILSFPPNDRRNRNLTSFDANPVLSARKKDPEGSCFFIN